VIENEVTDSNWIGQALTIDQFKIHEDKVLGEGAYGMVFEGETHGIAVAIKKLSVITQVDTFVKECTVLSKILLGRRSFQTHYFFQDIGS